MLQILEERYERKSVIIASQLPIVYKLNLLNGDIVIFAVNVHLYSSLHILLK